MVSILLLFDVGQHFAETLVLDHNRMGHALVLIEYLVRQRVTFPSNIQSTISVSVCLDILSNYAARDVVLLKHDAFALIGE
ncbi:hypothetical protein D3C72_1872000 [compost metagenome]